VSNQTLEPFGRYRLVEKLAEGGMAEIYLAKSVGARGFEKPVVIKCILPELAEDDDFVRMFIDEAKVMLQLSHPKVVQVLDFGEEQGRHFIVMEQVRGIDGLALLRRCAHLRLRPTTGIAVHIAAEVLDALDYAHNLTDPEGQPLGILHRDISPSNIFLSNLGEVKLGDFGIAVTLTARGEAAARRMKGKYGYMAPELVTGDAVDRRSDLFSVGVLLAELLMIRRLFIAKTEIEVLLQVRDANLRRLNKHGGHIPADLREILDSALARDPESRYQDAATFRDALHRYLFDNRLMVHSHDVRNFLVRVEEQEDTPVKAPSPAPSSRAEQAGETGETAVIPRSVVSGAAAELEEEPPRVKQVGQKRKITLGPPAPPPPLPSGLPETGEVPRISTEDALAAVPEVNQTTGSAYDFRIPESDELRAVPVPEEPPRPEEPRAVAASRVSERRPAMVADDEGALEQRSLVQVTFQLALDEETGLLALHSGEAVKEVYLVDGDPHFVASNLPEELFGQYLVERGVIAEGELAMALAMLPHFEGKLGNTLVGLKLLRPMEVLRHLTLQVRQKLVNAYGWDSGRFIYFRGRRYEQEAAPLGLDGFEMIGAGVRALGEEALGRRLAPVLERRLKLSPSPVPPEAFRLGAEARGVYGKLDGRFTLAELLARYDNPEQRLFFLQVVYLFAETGLAVAEE